MQYDTFTLKPTTTATGRAVLEFKAFFDAGTVSGVWRAGYRFTTATMGVFKDGHLDRRHRRVPARASVGAGSGVQIGPKSTVDQTVTVTGL